MLGDPEIRRQAHTHLALRRGCNVGSSCSSRFDTESACNGVLTKKELQVRGSPCNGLFCHRMDVEVKLTVGGIPLSASVADVIAFLGKVEGTDIKVLYLQKGKQRYASRNARSVHCDYKFAKFPRAFHVHAEETEILCTVGRPYVQISVFLCRVRGASLLQPSI